jgi:hypothetical protein
MICLFADLSLFALNRGTRRQSLHYTLNHTESHCAAFARAGFPRECSNVLRFLIAIATATPKAAALARGVANLSLRASSQFRNLMRPTGEASGPVSGGFVLPV